MSGGELAVTKLLGTIQSRRCKRAFGQLRGALRRELESVVAATLGEDDPPSPQAKNGKIFVAALVLVCGTVKTGPVPLYISNLLGLDRRRVARLAWEARKAGIFGGGGVHADPWVEPDPAGAMINFVLDAMGSISYEGPRGPNRIYRSIGK
jgi:hypothetical protein